jgi:molybdate-binding protein
LAAGRGRALAPCRPGRFGIGHGRRSGARVVDHPASLARAACCLEAGRAGAQTGSASFGGLRDIAKRRLRFVNRQSGAGSRLFFDLLLADAGLKPSSIQGDHNEEYTHLAVAAMVAAGEADVGFGARAATKRFGLQFHREVREKYLLAVPREDLHRKPCALLQHVLGSTVVKRAGG